VSGGVDHVRDPEQRTRESRGIPNEQAPWLRCLMCGCTQHQVIFKEFDVDILRCRECHHVFSSFPADPHYGGFWGDEVADDDHSYWSKARNRMYQDFTKRFLVRRSGRLLDMGCGLGFFVKCVTGLENWEAYGCEISPAAVRYARKNLGLRNVLCGRLEDVELPQDSFDIVTMWDVIDHILYPDPLLQRCHTLLRSGGICFIRTPNVSIQLPRARIKKQLRGLRANVSYLQARAHLHHYSMSTICRLLERSGFTDTEFIHLRPVQETPGAILLPGVKNVWFEAVRALAGVSRGHLNFDNLFVVARKRS
jgi:SAM-dependent methyltransferase